MIFYKDRSCHHYGRQVDWPKSIRSLVASFPKTTVDRSAKKSYVSIRNVFQKFQWNAINYLLCPGPYRPPKSSESAVEGRGL